MLKGSRSLRSGRALRTPRAFWINQGVADTVAGGKGGDTHTGVARPNSFFIVGAHVCVCVSLNSINEGFGGGEGVLQKKGVISSAHCS